MNNSGIRLLSAAFAASAALSFSIPAAAQTAPSAAPAKTSSANSAAKDKAKAVLAGIKKGSALAKEGSFRASMATFDSLLAMKEVQGSKAALAAVLSAKAEAEFRRGDFAGMRESIDRGLKTNPKGGVLKKLKGLESRLDTRLQANTFSGSAAMGFGWDEQVKHARSQGRGLGQIEQDYKNTFGGSVTHVLNFDKYGNQFKTTANISKSYQWEVADANGMSYGIGAGPVFNLYVFQMTINPHFYYKRAAKDDDTDFARFVLGGGLKLDHKLTPNIKIGAAWAHEAIHALGSNSDGLAHQIDGKIAWKVTSADAIAVSSAFRWEDINTPAAGGVGPDKFQQTYAVKYNRTFEIFGMKGFFAGADVSYSFADFQNTSLLGRDVPGRNRSQKFIRRDDDIYKWGLTAGKKIDDWTVTARYSENHTFSTVNTADKHTRSAVVNVTRAF